MTTGSSAVNMSRDTTPTTSDNEISGSVTSSLRPTTSVTTAAEITADFTPEDNNIPERSKWELLVVVSCLGAAVVVILGVLVLLGTKRRRDDGKYLAGFDETYSIVTYEFTNVSATWSTSAVTHSGICFNSFIMAGRLLFIILMCSFHKIQVQDL
ncbi:uncharacterized protein LOC125006378 isoform X2 [Mugil cephalus]|uniref:uncharacterized protein LOC125006378 isoform X2 n=1 Tax=Mugil cephalus TaxID=48193 RepID=UPI001FB68B67|nr:uncharacterized protein LOC125006378 isoform X2 [Mugil cephalus]